MNPQLEKLKSALHDNLLELSDLSPGIDRLNKVLKLIDTSVEEIYSIRDEMKFTDKDEEIYFYKHYFPEILACRTAEVMIYHIHKNVPIGTDESKLKYFEEELKARKSFFRMNSFHYQYFKSGLSDLDGAYFLADAGPLPVPAADVEEFGSDYAPAMTYLFAKFTAYERIQYHILQQITQISHPELHSSKSTAATDLRWTGDSVNMVELAYGIWLTGQLNNGNASLNQIVRWLESTLNKSIGIIQRRFSEIERRKRLSVTKFIDQMKDAIHKKIESGNS